MKRYLVWCIKVIEGGLLAFAFLSIWCIAYYKVPPRFIDADIATDYCWRPDTFRCTMREGFAWGKTNNEGYFNALDYNEGMPLDAVIMGSSQMEGFNVNEDQSTAAVLNGKLGDSSIYNLGLSDYNFMLCVDDLSDVLAKYNPSKYVIIQTNSLQISDETMRDFLTGKSISIGSRAEGIELLLQYDPYLRLLYKQVQGYIRAHNNTNSQATYSDAKLLEGIFKYISDTAKDSNAKIIVIYNPSIIINQDGTIEFTSTTQEENAFNQLCKDYDICFLNMRDSFLKEYEENHRLPYGFANTECGEGHLNALGHKLIAEELYTVITSLG